MLHKAVQHSAKQGLETEQSSPTMAVHTGCCQFLLQLHWVIQFMETNYSFATQLIGLTVIYLKVLRFRI